MLKETFNDPFIKTFLKEHDLKENQIKAVIPFEYYLSSKKICSNCKGLSNCQQSKVGEYISLEYDGVVYNAVAYCDYYLLKLKKDRILSNFVKNDIPMEYENLTLGNIELLDSNVAMLNSKCLDVISGTTKKGLYIYGDLGVGKTYMCYALANSLVRREKQVAFIKVNQFVNEMRKLIITDSAKYDKTIKNIARVSYLIMDDIGSETVSDYSRDDLLFYILDYRMENKLTTIFTSNLSKKELKEHYKFNKRDVSSVIRAERLHERIDILSEDYFMTGTNKRRI